MKKLFNILFAILMIAFLIFIWLPHKTTVTCTDEDGNVVILNKDSLDAAHKKSWENYGK